MYAGDAHYAQPTVEKTGVDRHRSQGRAKSVDADPPEQSHGVAGEAKRTASPSSNCPSEPAPSRPECRRLPRPSAAHQADQFTHQTSTVGDLFPAKDSCRVARERGIRTLVDGAQSFGLLDVDLSDMQPDFYSGSAHKWPCGPKENGVLYINKSAQSKIWASIFSAYPGRVGVSRTFEGFGQRDEPTMMAFGEALKIQTRSAVPRSKKRSRD